MRAVQTCQQERHHGERDHHVTCMSKLQAGLVGDRGGFVGKFVREPHGVASGVFDGARIVMPCLRWLKPTSVFFDVDLSYRGPHDADDGYNTGKDCTTE